MGQMLHFSALHKDQVNGSMGPVPTLHFLLRYLNNMGTVSCLGKETSSWVWGNEKIHREESWRRACTGLWRYPQAAQSSLGLVRFWDSCQRSVFFPLLFIDEVFIWNPDAQTKSSFCLNSRGESHEPELTLCVQLFRNGRAGKWQGFCFSLLRDNKLPRLHLRNTQEAEKNQ